MQLSDVSVRPPATKSQLSPLGVQAPAPRHLTAEPPGLWCGLGSYRHEKRSLWSIVGRIPSNLCLPSDTSLPSKTPKGKTTFNPLKFVESLSLYLSLPQVGRSPTISSYFLAESAFSPCAPRDPVPSRRSWYFWEQIL